MRVLPEDPLEAQFLYGREPWWSCWDCIQQPPWERERKVPDVAFEALATAPKPKEPGLFDNLFEETNEP